MKCPKCNTKTKHDGTWVTCVGYSSPNGHDHDDNCHTRLYHCKNCHNEWIESKRNKCPVWYCHWKGKKTCFCHRGQKVSKWSDGEKYYDKTPCNCYNSTPVKKDEFGIPIIDIQLKSTPVTFKPRSCPLCNQECNSGGFVSRKRPKWLHWTYDTYYPEMIYSFIQKKIFRRKLGGLAHKGCIDKMNTDTWGEWKFNFGMTEGYVYAPYIPDALTNKSNDTSDQ